MGSEQRDMYCELMWQIKQRVDHVMTMDICQDEAILCSVLESACLQLRKVLETIAWACLVANGDRLESLSAKIRKEYHAGRLLRRLEQVVPDCYPTPLIRIPTTYDGAVPGDVFVIGEGDIETPPGEYRGELIEASHK